MFFYINNTLSIFSWSDKKKNFQFLSLTRFIFLLIRYWLDAILIFFYDIKNRSNKNTKNVSFTYFLLSKLEFSRKWIYILFFTITTKLIKKTFSFYDFLIIKILILLYILFHILKQNIFFGIF